MNRIKIDRKDNNFAILDCTALRDNRLSLKAKGLHSYIYQLPNDWDLSIEGLSRVLKEGKSSIRSAVKELEECGYLTRQRTTNTGNQFSGYDYTIYEKPFDIPVVRFSDDGTSDNGKPHAIKELKKLSIVDSKESTAKTPISNQKKDELTSLDEKIITYLTAIDSHLQKYGKKLTIPKTKTALHKYYAYRAVKRTVSDFKATVEQWQGIIDLKALEWKNDPKMQKFLKCDTIAAHWTKYLEEVEERKGNEAPTDDTQLEPLYENRYNKFCEVYSVEGTNLTQLTRSEYKSFFVDNFSRITTMVAKTAIMRELHKIINTAKSDGEFGKLYKKLYHWYEIKAGLKKSYN